MRRAEPADLLGQPLPPSLAAILRLCMAPTSGNDDPSLAEAAVSLQQWMEDPLNARSFIPHPALLIRTIRAYRIAVPTPLRRRLEAAALREEKRSSMAAEQAARLDNLLGGMNCQPVRGWHFAQAYYPDPLARHSHAIRWLAPDPADAARLIDLVSGEGWTERVPAPPLAGHKLVFGGRDRITVEIHRRPFPWSKECPDADVVRSAEFTAVELIAAALIEPHARMGLWAVDLGQLVRHRRFDAAAFATVARQYGVAATVRRGLDATAALCSLGDRATLAVLEAMTAALAAAPQPVRDSRPVRDLIRVQRMAATPRRHLLLKGLGRPDLLIRSQLLRKHRLARSRASLAARERLKESQSSNRR